ncbi:MAG TPA: DUF309 domain-containing protein [Terriglobales bacterium]|nr:DUF309 domain-containing protein [Terriglobales bacterium]
MQLDWSKGKLAEGLRHYNANEFFAAHEAWECVWLEATGREKMFLQALIQVAAALHHQCRNNPKGTVLLFQAALSRLDSCPAVFGGMSVAILRDDIRNRLQASEAGYSAPGLLPPRMCPVNIR